MDAKTNPKYPIKKKQPKQYPAEIKKQAIELFESCRPDFPTRALTSAHVADLLGVGCAETVMSWVRQAEVDGGLRSGTTTEQNEEIRRLKKENAELRRTNGILKAASAFFAAELDRPADM